MLKGGGIETQFDKWRKDGPGRENWPEARRVAPRATEDFISSYLNHISRHTDTRDNSVSSSTVTEPQ